MNHSYLTVVAIYGHTDGSEAIPAIEESMRQLPGSKGLLISIEKPKNINKDIEWKRVFPFDYRQYSMFVMYCLRDFIETEFCLVVQDDGWVLSGNNWQDKFLDYDYIGAPCHAAIVGGSFFKNYRWINEPSPLIIQNGGFSLRSKKFLECPSRSGIVYKFNMDSVLEFEDVQLTGIFKHAMEAMGIKFAQDDLAKQFSVEFLNPVFHKDLSLCSLFGFHGAIRKLKKDKRVVYSVSENFASSISGEVEIMELLRHLDYSIDFEG